MRTSYDAFENFKRVAMRLSRGFMVVRAFGLSVPSIRKDTLYCDARKTWTAKARRSLQHPFDCEWESAGARSAFATEEGR